MADIFVPHTPPSSVPGPYREPATPSPYKRPVSQPHWRYIDVPTSVTLQTLAMRYYSDVGAAIRLFNDNMLGKRMPDGTLGTIQSPNQIMQPGQRVWLS